MSIELAHSPHASPEQLQQLVDQFDKTDRSLGEALLLNRNLSQKSLDQLLPLCSIDLQLLALTHPHLSTDSQVEIVSSIAQIETRTTAKLILLGRSDLSKDVVAILCLDPIAEVREKAINILRKINDTNSNNNQ